VAYDYPSRSYQQYSVAPETLSEVAAPSSLAVSPQGYQFVTNKGKNAGTKANRSGYVAVDPNAQYRFVNLRGDDSVMYEGTGAEGLQGVYDLARQQSTDLGKKAYWSAERYDPTTESWVSVADDPRGGLKGAINKYGDVVLPALAVASLAIPGFQPFAALGLSSASAGAAGLAAGLGSAASSAAQGRGLGSTLGRALMTGGLAYGGASLAPGISGALGGTTSNAASSTAGELAEQGITSGVTKALGDAATNAALDTIIVNGVRQAGTNALMSAGSGALGSLGGSALGNAIGQASNPNVINVTGPQPTPPPNLEQVLGPVAAVPGGLVDGNILPPETPNPDEIIVTGERAKPVVNNLAAAGIPAAAAGGAALNALTSTQAPTQQPTEKPTTGSPSTLEEISTWLQRAGLVSSVLGPLAEAIAGGGGGSGNRNINAAGLGALNPVFSAQLPAANLPMRQPRDMSGTDWNRYAFGPEQSFFTNVPQRLAKGGLAHSDGRSDDVPAMLSRGEYVIDAETMALLGNGDPFAGADKMDEWRVNVRKHKGRQLMKGDISPDAKMPNQYMGGGRV
jgi:hypothetical protein